MIYWWKRHGREAAQFMIRLFSLRLIGSAQDNDFSTSWSCDESTETDGDCNLIFNLFWYRHIKQVKIGEFSIVYTRLRPQAFGIGELAMRQQRHKKLRFVLAIYLDNDVTYFIRPNVSIWKHIINRESRLSSLLLE